MLEEYLCPFCSSKTIRHIYDAKVKKTDSVKPLYRCDQCEEFFWKDSGERVEWLSNLCETRWLESEKCNESVLNFFPQQGTEDSPLENIKKLDRICSDCPYKKFSI